MADEETPKTTEETPETVEETPAAVEETPAPAAADVEAEEDRPAGDVNPPGPALSRAEQRAAAQHTEASKRPARTPEERHAEREAERKRKAAQRRRRRVKEREKRKQAKPEPAEPTLSVHEPTTGRPKVRTGRVVSDKADQTITVRIELTRRHRRYEKVMRSTSTLHAHDASNDANEGDLVRVIEARPLSKTKRWRLIEVLERAR
jgi:small subunit ribosomal protein S17